MTRLGVFEDAAHEDLAPLASLRPTFLLWCGIAPVWQRAAALYGAPVGMVRCRAGLASGALREIAPPPEPPGAAASPALLVNGALRLGKGTARSIPLDGDEEMITSAGRIVAVRLSAATLAALPMGALPASADDPLPSALAGLPRREAEAALWTHPWDLIASNEETLRADFEIFEKMIEPRRIAPVEEIGVDCYLGEGVRVSQKASLSAGGGPILIGAGATIEPFVFIEGPAFVGGGARVRAGSRIEGGSTIGPGCRVGGEIEASILFPFMNKQHDGFLGHSVVGSWANLGAGTITSDLKNNYGMVRSYSGGERVDTGIRKLGALIGDHAKLGIGTLVGAGTVVGVAAQIAGAGGVVSGLVPAFAWWTGSARAVHDVDRAVETARTVLSRRGRRLEDDEETALRAHFEERASVRDRSAWLAGR